MIAVVTGAAGFIGSQLSEQLIELGHVVRGIDNFTDYYDPKLKHSNLEGLLASGGFELFQYDLAMDDLLPCLDGAEVIFHLAGQPGVRASWAEGFSEYTSFNIIATQRLLESARQMNVRRFVYASSSSIYGNATSFPVRETDLPRPHSPYGVTKLAAEHLCSLYARNYGVPTVSLRYFTVYGPRQRPDMAFRRLVRAAFTGEMFPLYGSGHQVRDFTYVSDVVSANLLAAERDVSPGEVINIAGGSSVSMLEVIEYIGRLVGKPIKIDYSVSQPGDVDRTEASIKVARALLGWQPSIDLRQGLNHMVEWAQQYDAS